MILIDADGSHRHALVAQVWHSRLEGGPFAPLLNLVVITYDEPDRFGRPVDLLPSIRHLSEAPSRAWCWAWPEEAALVPLR